MPDADPVSNTFTEQWRGPPTTSVSASTFDSYTITVAASLTDTHTIRTTGPYADAHGNNPASGFADPAAQAVNLSTRMYVSTGNNVGIAGFIIAGTAPKQVLLRAIGPSLGSSGITNPLADPVMELHGPPALFLRSRTTTGENTQEAAIQATGIPPSSDLESAIPS